MKRRILESGITKVRRILGISLMMILMLTALTGCSQNPSDDEVKEEEEEDTLDIGLSIDSLVIERWQRERDLFVSKATELGAEVNVQNANGEVEEQIKQIQYFIDKKVDVIVIISIDDEALNDVIAKAKKAGIRVIAYDRLIRNANVDVYMSVDNERVGELMATYIKKAIGNSGTIIQIKGSPTDYNVQMVQNGFERIISTTDIHIVYSEYSDNWMAENGYRVTSNYLASGRVPDAIMCGNDNIASQSIRALNENRLGGQVCVVGQDADLEACQRIVEGTQYMTVFKPVEMLAKSAAEMAVAMAKGEDLGIKDTINDGTYDVPYEKLDPIAVTAENMDEVITGKYHQESEIYINVRD
ncbi:MAG: substrate-binding domain-containing protein [Lachnospiraceae bacterium]|nr:substrate-binding domain-containing protein [Lachnospiraceae bacterium]